MVGKKSVHKKTIITEVVEKKAPKKTTVKKTTSTTKPASNLRIENALIENFISLQKVMVNLSSNFDNLSNKISKLLDLFEISAKTLAEKEFAGDKEKKESKEVMQKMDEILEQNKILARGLTLMHDRISEESEIPFSKPVPVQIPQRAPVSRPLPQLRSQIQEMKSSMNSPVKELNDFQDDTYRRSISSNNNDAGKTP